MKKDKVVAGGLAGAIGALAQAAYGILVKYIGLTDRAFVDFAQVILFYKQYTGILAFIMGVISHLIFGLILGVIFAYILPITSDNYYYLKGIFYGAIIWFASLGVGTLYDLPVFKDIPPIPALTTFIGALIWGLVNSYVYKLIWVTNNN